MEFLGGDLPKDKLKPVSDPEVVAYQQALSDLIKAIALLNFLGKTLKDYDPSVGS